MKIDGIKIKNYRSFDDKEGIILQDFGKINIFIGKNNCGKSNILYFINNLKNILFRSVSPNEMFKTTDFYNFRNENQVTFSLEYKRGSELNQIIDSIPNPFKSHFDDLESLMIDFSLSSKDKIYNINFAANKWIKEVIKDNETNRKKFLEVLSRSDSYIENIKNLFKQISVPKYDDICLINTHREIKVNKDKINKDSDVYKTQLYNGFDLIDRMDVWKDPRPLNQNQRKYFDEIENFIRDILNENDLTLEISSDEGYGKELSLKMKGKQVPIENLSTGINQLIILASTVTVLQNYIICIEEPEIFIHPEIQRKFIKYLLSTTNQYFISTHSNTFLNIEGADIYSISHDGEKSSATKVLSSIEKNILLDDLGYLASDLLQTNYLIWVEGPSDRIYLNNWINRIDESLLIDIHYSIMFYGGKLLAHLSIDEKALDDFIKLNKINRNVGIVIDSDKEDENDIINKTKQRIVDEFSKQNFFNWVTMGREIENYITKTDLINAIKLLSGNSDINIEYGKFKHLTNYNVDGNEKKVDKILLARTVTKSKMDLSVLDLDERISELIERIRKANSL